jgi:hypothetical protein
MEHDPACAFRRSGTGEAIHLIAIVIGLLGDGVELDEGDTD